MGKSTKSIEIEASPEKVFAFIISDKMNDVWREWMDGKWDSQGPVGVGSIGHYDPKGSMSNFGKIKIEVTEVEKNKKMTMHSTAAKSKWVNATDSLVLEPAAKGTKVAWVTEYKVPYSILGKLIDKVRLSKEIEKMNVKSLENLKKALEA